VTAPADAVNVAPLLDSRVRVRPGATAPARPRRPALCHCGDCHV